jgi:hypothetical protein
MNSALKKALVAASACFALTMPAFSAEPESHQVVALTNEAGIVIREDWMLEKEYRPSGTYHRIGAPAFIRREDTTGIIILEHWMQNGKFHRDDGPAIIARDHRTGTVTLEEWWKNGIQIPPPDNKHGPFPQ